MPHELFEELVDELVDALFEALLEEGDGLLDTRADVDAHWDELFELADDCAGCSIDLVDEFDTLLFKRCAG